MSVELVRKTNKLLEKICKRLYKDHFFDFDGSLNYSVSVEIFSAGETGNFDEVDLIGSILNADAEVSEIEESNLSELLENVKEGFEFTGDEGSYPNKGYLGSEDFRIDVKEGLKQLEDLFFDNSEILKFWLKKGHPFYPVYWDYAFLIKKAGTNLILIGSSSD